MCSKKDLEIAALKIKVAELEKRIENQSFRRAVEVSEELRKDIGVLKSDAKRNKQRIIDMLFENFKAFARKELEEYLAEIRVQEYD